jgi:hypothetical protein
MKYEIYPNSTPEFRMFQKIDGTTIMQVRYINKLVGYTGLWMDVETKKEEKTEQ